jgi:hypothetical protein
MLTTNTLAYYVYTKIKDYKALKSDITMLETNAIAY